MKGLVYLSGEDHLLALGELRGAMKALGMEECISYVNGPLVILNDRPPVGLASRMGYCRFSAVVELTGTTCPEWIERGIDRMLEGYDRSVPLSLEVKAALPELKGLKKEIKEMLEGHLRRHGFRLKYNDASERLLVCIDDVSYLGWVIEEADRRSFRKRGVKNLPFERPVVMAPSLSRAMVNLSGLPPGSRVIDPFMGPASLLIEAALLGLKCVGVEVDEKVAKGAIQNIQYIGPSEDVEVHVADSRDMTSRRWFYEKAPFHGVITDPPFGRSARVEGGTPESLLIEVVENILPFLVDGAPIVLDVIDISILDRLAGTEVVETYPVYVHRSMVRHLSLLRKA